MRRPRHRVGEPAELVLELRPGDDGGVEAHPRHRRERLAVGDRQVDPPVVGRPALVERDVEGRLRVAGDAERPRQQVGGAVRDDPERHAGRRHALGAAADGPVPADRHHQVGSVEGRPSGRRDPGLGLLGDVEFGRPAVPGGDLAAERHEPPADPGQRAVNDERDSRHICTEVTRRPGPRNNRPGAVVATGPSGRTRRRAAKLGQVAGLRYGPHRTGVRRLLGGLHLSLQNPEPQHALPAPHTRALKTCSGGPHLKLAPAPAREARPVRPLKPAMIAKDLITAEDLCIYTIIILRQEKRFVITGAECLIPVTQEVRGAQGKRWWPRRSRGHHRRGKLVEG